MHEAADQMVGGRSPRLWLEEVVVHDMERRNAEREPRETRLCAKGRRDACRGSPRRFGS